MGQWTNRVKAAAFGIAAIACLGGAPGCAEERDPINRVQEWAIPKSLFIRPEADGRYLGTDPAKSDSWYFRATITDVPTSQPVAFIGAAGEMYRVKWRISGDGSTLEAYREDPDILDSGDPHGGTIASFPIVSHFDIRKDYNSGTGEELNVIEENTEDRPWQYREFMRVDWGVNKISESMFVAPGFEQFSATKSWVQAQDDADHPEFKDGYVDITAKYTVMPSPAACFYYYRDWGCGPGDISARLSFMKVPDRDYEPRNYPDRVQLTDEKGDVIRSISGSPVGLPMMDQFGYFRTERAQYDKRYGSLEKKYLYRANIWNIWEKWYERDAAGQPLLHEDGSKVALPYKDRKVRPIVYFLNAEWPTELRQTAREVADAWNDTFSETVASLRLLEGKPAGAKILKHAELRAEVDAMRSRGERVYVLCENNPVKEGDNPACGKVGTVARQGDLRFSFMHWVPKPQLSGPLGFGPSYSDPITGELFSANAYIYGAAVDTYAQTATDIVNLLNGRFKEFDYINGIATDEYAKRLANGEVPGPRQSAVPGMNLIEPGKPGFSLAAAQQNVDHGVDRSLLKTIAEKGLPIAAGASGQDRLNFIRGTQLERKILDVPETHALVGKTPNDQLTDADLKTIGDTVFAQDMVKRENDRLKFLGEHGCYLDASLVDDSVVGLAREMAKKYPLAGSPREQEERQFSMWNELRTHILRGVLEHEVGHTVGLRHNFEGSSDALNFHDQFWNLKKDTLAFGAPTTDAQKLGKMSEYQYSTVMDYGSRFNSDIHSLGKYDYAAIRFGYGDLVESFPKGAIKDPLYNTTGRELSGFFRGYSAEVLDNINRGYRHYTQIPGEFDKGVESISRGAREIRPFSDIVQNARSIYLRDGTSVAKTSDALGGIDVVPYWYCGDEFAGSASRPLCQRWDQGMDPYEVVSDAMTRYQQYYVFDAFTRGRTNGFNLFRSYLSKIYSRYFSHVHSQYIHWLFYQGSNDYYWRTLFEGEDGVKKGWITNADWFKDPGGGLGATMATTWGLDRLVDVLGTPDVGVYIPSDDKTYFEQATSSPYACRTDQGETIRCGNGATQLTLDIADGARHRFTRYEGGSGQGFFNRIKNIGSFYDKIAALMTLTSTDTNFVGQDQTNAVSYRIGFYLAYPKVMSSIFGGVATDTYDQYAWRYEYLQDKVQLMSPNLFQSVGAQDDRPPAFATMRGQPIDGGWYFFYKAYAMFFSMAEFQSNFSQSWNDAVRVWCVGCGEAFDPAPGSTPITMADPSSGKQYAALQYGDNRYSPGAELIKKGQLLIQAIADAEARPTTDVNRTYYINKAKSDVANHIEFIDLVRGLYQVYGYTRF